MFVGNFAALLQTNIKRLLAYSSIAHAGYVMVAIAAHSQIGTAAAMFYLAAYALMNIGACQWSGVAITTASMSLSARSCLYSLYFFGEERDFLMASSM